MNELSSTEILTLENGISYAPVWIVTDKRISDPEKTTLKYPQVGGPTAADKIGNANGPIFNSFSKSKLKTAGRPSFLMIYNIKVMNKNPLGSFLVRVWTC